MTTRREKIEAMLVAEPNDPFLRYALSQELDKAGENDRSLAMLRELAYDRAAPHIPSYFMAGQQLVRLGRIEEARAFLRDGIEEARRQDNGHAASEMSALLMDLGSMGE
jgi:Flp pilus assembly protein TadD